MEREETIELLRREIAFFKAETKILREERDEARREARDLRVRVIKLSGAKWVT